MRPSQAPPGGPSAVVFHFPCLDGLVAAWVAVRSVAPAATLFPFSHGEPSPEVSGFDSVFVFDLSFPADVLERWSATNGRVLLLDHHVSAERELGGSDLLVPLGRTLLRFDDPSFSGLSASVVSERSGAGLAALAASACGFVDLVPDLVWDVEDRDLWRWSVPGSREVCEVLHAEVEGLGCADALRAVDRLVSAPRETLVSAGSELLRRRSEAAARLAGEAVMVTVAGFEVPFARVDVPGLGSDVGAALLGAFPDAPFVGFFSVPEAGGPLRVGLRSEDGREDVSRVAALFGGGGHRNASGLSCASLEDLGSGSGE